MLLISQITSVLIVYPLTQICAIELLSFRFYTRIESGHIYHNYNNIEFCICLYTDAPQFMLELCPDKHIITLKYCKSSAFNAPNLPNTIV